MRRFLIWAALLSLPGCVGGGGYGAFVDLFDRLDWLRERYNSALNGVDYSEQTRIEVAIARDANDHFAELAETAANESSVRLRYLATFALGFSDRRLEAAGILRARLDDRDPFVKIAAAVALGQLQLPNPPVDRVRKMLDDPSVEVRLGGLAALRLMLQPGQDGGVGGKLVSFLDDSNDTLRNEAVLVMGRSRKPEFLDPLVRKGFKDPYLLVRVNAAIAVGSYEANAEHRVPHLIELLRDLEAKVVEAAWWALKKVTGKDFDRSYHTWRDWYEVEVRPLFEYFCSKDAEVVRDTAGPCPACGAALERRRRVEPVYVCPDHPEVLQKVPGRCPTCQKELLKKEQR